MAAGLCGNRARFSAMDFWCRVAFLFGPNGGGKNGCGSLWHEAESFSNDGLGMRLLGDLVPGGIVSANLLTRPGGLCARRIYRKLSVAHHAGGHRGSLSPWRGGPVLGACHAPGWPRPPSSLVPRGGCPPPSP